MATITAEMEAELIQLFERFDSNHSGFIEEQEFGQILDSLGDHEPGEVRSLEFAAVDADGDGRVRFRDFANWWLDSRDWRTGP